MVHGKYRKSNHCLPLQGSKFKMILSQIIRLSQRYTKYFSSLEIVYRCLRQILPVWLQNQFISCGLKPVLMYSIVLQTIFLEKKLKLIILITVLLTWTFSPSRLTKLILIFYLDNRGKLSYNF